MSQQRSSSPLTPTRDTTAASSGELRGDATSSLPAREHEDASSNWRRICAFEDIPRLGARVVKHGKAEIAVFRNADDAVFALADRCPHKGGKLSQGIVFNGKVACPLHGWTICLQDGKAVAPDEGCAKTFDVKVEGGEVFLSL